MSSSNRRHRQSRRQPELLDPAPPHTLSTSASHSPPHPYHESPHPPPPPPPAQQPFQERSTSSESRLSDLSTDDFAGSARDSVFDYSDTSDDMREDSYFMPEENPSSPPGLLGGHHVHRRPYNPYQRNGGRSASGESSFRDLKISGGKSSRVVQFASESRIECFSDSADHRETSSGFIDDYPDTKNAEDNSHESKRGPNLSGSGAERIAKMAWMKKVAFAFRSPSGVRDKDAKHMRELLGDQNENSRDQPGKINEAKPKHTRAPSGSTMEYAHSMFRHPSEPSKEVKLPPLSSETSPLLSGRSNSKRYSPATSACEVDRNGHNILDPPKNDGDDSNHFQNSLTSVPGHRHVFASRKTASRVAANFLLDYEASRPPTLPSDFESITREQLTIYSLHFSWPWRLLVNVAIAALFLSQTQSLPAMAGMNTFSVAILMIEIQMKENMYFIDSKVDISHPDRKLVRPMTAFLVFLFFESWMWCVMSTAPIQKTARPLMFSSIFKPLVFFYVSSKARYSLEALWSISQIVTRVLLIELGLILTFASVGCRMFGAHHESFESLSASWLSLFELSTTVVNPSLWMPIYHESQWNAIFFVVFIITCMFYYHSLCLSVVFSTYIRAATEVHERYASDREDAVRLAFLAMMKDGQSDFINISSVRKCLQAVRPHYNTHKMKALMEIVDPSEDRVIDYPTFRTKIRAGLNASIRTARASTAFAMGVELIAVVLAVVNFIYVIMVTSDWEAGWFNDIRVVTGSILTLTGLLELLIRFNPLRLQHFAPITRLNPFFDGLALTAALTSCIGFVQYSAGYAISIDSGIAIDFLLLGRAIDMIRVMRFSPTFRDVIKRSEDVLPALAGPLVLMLATWHLFVCCGTLIWGGAIDVEKLMETDELTSLYCLNNFNSYTSGLVTMFNVAVVNDWHAIAEVFLFAERNSEPVVVYGFFIFAICTTVFIILNVITAFFVESFVTKRSDATEENVDDDNDARRGFQIRTGENTNVKRVSGTSARRPLLGEEEEHSSASPEIDHAASPRAESDETFSFDIYEREGFDQIMRTVAGSSDAEQETFARNVCHYLEMFESLSSQKKVGYIVCCQQSMNRFGNRRFATTAKEFISDDTLHKVVSDMHSECLVLSIRKKNFENRCLVRTFMHPHDTSKMLEVTATLLKYQPAATLLVSQVRTPDSSIPDSERK